MGRIEKTVFISYRRTNYWTALAIFQNLNANGYDVFFDYKSIPSGDFEQAIIENIKSRAHFIVVLSSSALERCNEPGDWLRREMETAIDNQRNIIPLIMDGFDFGSPSTLKALTGKLDAFKKYNGLGIPAEYFDEAMAKLRGERFLNKPLESVSHPVADITKKITEEQKSTASEAEPVQFTQLTAEEWYERGYVFEKNKNFDEAVRCYNKAINLVPNYVEAYFVRGYLAEKKNNINDALQDYNRAISAKPVKPENAIFYVFRGILLANKGNMYEAIEDFQNAIRTNPSYALSYASLGKILTNEKIKRYTEAEDAYRQAIAIDPNDAIAHSNFGILLQILERYAEAEDAHRQAIAIDPNYASAYCNLGWLLHKDLGRYTEAEGAYRQAIAIDPNDAIAHSNLGLLLHEKLGRYKEAEDAYRQAIAIDPNYATAHYNLGLLLHTKLGRYKKAEDAYRQAIAIDPNDNAAYHNLGLLLHEKLERYSEAETAYRKVIAEGTNYSKPYNNLGNLLKKLKRYTEAEDAYRQAIAKEPYLTTGYNNLVILFRLNHRLEEAIPLLEKIIEINSEDFNPYIAVASINKQMGNGISEENIMKARQRISEDDWSNRACLESICDNFDQAFEYLEKAAQLEGFNPGWAWDDPDLQWLRDDPRFVKIVGLQPK